MIFQRMGQGRLIQSVRRPFFPVRWFQREKTRNMSLVHVDRARAQSSSCRAEDSADRFERSIIVQAIFWEPWTLGSCEDFSTTLEGLRLKSRSMTWWVYKWWTHGQRIRSSSGNSMLNRFQTHWICGIVQWIYHKILCEKYRFSYVNFEVVGSMTPKSHREYREYCLTKRNANIRKAMLMEFSDSSETQGSWEITSDIWVREKTGDFYELPDICSCFS
jgi:hypothetical protein